MTLAKDSSFIATGLMRWLIVLAVMLVAIIEVLDITIVNVALSPMMGALGATRDQITWVLTAYIVSAAIVMPLTGYLVNVLGRKRLLLMNICGFMFASLLCGLSHSLFQIVFFRVLQGAFGACLIPLSQYILLDTFHVHERGKAMAIWGVGVMVGPVLGPTLGGFITDAASWRWIFFINLPVCIIAFLLAGSVIRETPRIQKYTDWWGMFLLTLGIGSLQMFLDRGETEDWFDSRFILTMAISAVVFLTIFIVRGIKKTNNIIHLALFRDYQFAMSCILVAIFSMGIFSLIALQPMMLQQLMGYSPKMAGLLMAPRGISSAIGMMMVARYITFADARLFVMSGLLIAAFTSYYMSCFNLETSFYVMAIVNLLQGFGVGLFFVPITTIAFSALPEHSHAEASGLFNFARSLGTSIGISLSSTALVHFSQINWNRLSGHFSPENPHLQHFLSAHQWTLQNQTAMMYILKQMNLQSGIIAFINVFWVLSIGFFLAMLMVCCMKKSIARGMVVAE